MRGQHGFTMLEVLAVLAVAATLAAVAVPGAAGLHHALADHLAAHRLALVLRHAQARAQAHGTGVLVTVAADGAYRVSERIAGQASPQPVAAGRLEASVSSNYSAGVEFSPRGWPCNPGTTSPRAGSFVAGTHRVVVQLGGFIRCL